MRAAPTEVVRRSRPATRAYLGTQPQRERIILVAIVGGAVAVIGFWWIDAPARSIHTLADRLTAAGRITGLVGTYLVVVQVALMARMPWLDRWIGTDRLSAWHRSNGQYTIVMLGAHTLLITAGYALQDHVSLGNEAGKLLRYYPDVLAATVAMGVLIAIGFTCARWARRHLRYETWYFVHLYTYVAIALSFSHQLATGNEFATHPLSRALWVGLYVVVGGMLFVFRVATPIRDAFVYRMRVASVQTDGADAVSVYVTGRHLDRLSAESGQFFRWRFLDRSSWWEAHPFSLSAAPNSRWLRITAKGVGDHSRALRHVRPGVRVVAEGPFGNLTSRRRTQRRVLLIAGGVGITPLRALAETLPAEPGDLTLLYRASRDADILFRDELDDLATSRGIEVAYLTGDRTIQPDPLSAAELRGRVRDIDRRDIYLCGPPRMMDAVVESLRSLKVPRRRIHREQFEL